jgi:elongation factor 3
MEEIILYKKLIHDSEFSNITQLNPCIMEQLMTQITNELDNSDWKRKIHFLELIKNLIELYPSYIVRCLPELTIKLRQAIQDTKDIVTHLALDVLKKICDAIDNVDIQKSMDVIIKAYISPISNTRNAIDKLYSTTFINEVDTATLSLVIPILLRSMSDKNTVYKRRSVVIIDNLTKLVSEPTDALLFYNPITTFLKKVMDEVQFDEIRKVAGNALYNITKLYNENTFVDENVIRKTITEYFSNDNDEVVEYVTHLIHFLVKNKITEKDEWDACITPYFENSSLFLDTFYHKCIQTFNLSEEDLETGDQDLCNIEFSLAYGSIVLLHKTKLHLKLNHKYALVGPNGAGKSTLMKSIANQSLAGFPSDIKTCYIAHEIQGDVSNKTCIDYISGECNISKDEAIEELIKFNFDDIHMNRNICDLSGGWKNKLNLCKAIISKASLLLLDEPTNHLDSMNVKWLTEYIQNIRNVSCLIVSHEPSFINAVCTDIIHYEKNKKLKKYKGNLNDFIKIVPEAKFYDEITTTNDSFQFPDCGFLEGVKSLTKAVLKMSFITFQYPHSLQPQLIDVSAQCSLGSRVGIVGVNGSGKSTMIKVLLGELIPQKGEVYKHPNLRVAYISQHAFKNVEEHLDKTPVQYIQWRYSAGVDKEALARDALKVSEEEEQLRKDKLKERKQEPIQAILTRKYGKRDFEYEVQWENMSLDNSYLNRKELEEMGYSKMIMEFDETLVSVRLNSGKKLTTNEIQKHLDGFGITTELGTHNYINALSGGQKVRVAFASSTWNNPHIIIMDEPTNFLDRGGVAALMNAINTFSGGVVIISHNDEFTRNVCKETWFVENGRVRVEGSEWLIVMEQNRKKAEKEASKKLPVQQDEKRDSLGNLVVEEATTNTIELDRKQRKILEKKRKEMLKQNLDTYELDVQLGLV